MMTTSKDYTFNRRIIRDILLKYFGFKVIVVPHVEGLENIPASGPTILMMNHTITIDGVIVLGVVRPRFVIPMTKTNNFDHWFFGFWARRWGAYAIRQDDADREALKLTLALLEQGALLLIAPEGHRQPQLHDPKDGLSYVAAKSGSTIVPTAVFNLETWYSDLLRPRRTHANVRFGKPFRLKAKGRLSRAEMRQATQEMMYQLAALLPEKYRGDYADLSKMTTHYLEY